MRVVVLRPPYNTLDHSSGDEDRSYGDSSKQRHFGTPGNSKLLEYYQGNRHKGIATGGASLNDVPEVEFELVFGFLSMSAFTECELI